MDHPNIAKVLDAGATDTGRPYFVMELVRGIPITRYCIQERLGTRERLELFIKACQAIQHAHQKGLIHRDIKPSNIMVTLHDGVPVPKVIDFGIAKATQQELTEKTVYTQYNQFIGTPAYMSPEQAEMSGLDIDTRSDIYSLGVLLYELLTGSTPFDTKQLMQSGLDQMRKIIRESEPVKPSTRVSQTLAAGGLGGSTADGVRRGIAAIESDLDWIVMKCLEKDRTRRYETANGLAMDLHRQMKDEPVVARPPSTAYRIGKLIRRNRLAFGAVTAVAVVLLLGIAVSAWLAVRATKAEQEQNRLRQLAESAHTREQAQRLEAEEARIRESRLRREAEARTYAADMIAVQVALQAGNLGRARKLLAFHQRESGEEDVRGFEWKYFWGQTRGNEIATWLGHSNVVSDLAFSSDGTMLATASSDQTIRVWNTETYQIATILRGHGNEVWSVAFAPDGEFLVSGCKDETIKTWKHNSRSDASVIAGVSLPVVYSPDGRTLAGLGEGERTLTLWDLDTRYARPLASESVPVSFVNEGATLVTLSESGGVEHLNLVTGAVEKTTDLAFTDDEAPLVWSILAANGKWLATAHEDRRMRLWDAISGEKVNTLGYETESGGNRFRVFSPDSRFITEFSGFMRPSFHDIETGISILAGSRHKMTITSTAYSPSGRVCVTGGSDGVAKLWDVETGAEIATLAAHREGVTAVAFSADGKTLAVGGTDGMVKLWNLRTFRDVGTIQFTSEVDHLWFSPDGNMLACHCGDDTVHPLEVRAQESL